MIIRRYLLKETSHTFFAVILVVFLIAVSNKLVRLVGQAVSGNISSSVLFHLIFFQIPDLLAFLLPVSLFLAILLCYSRLFENNEIPVMLSCGVSWQRLVNVSLTLGFMVMIFSGLLTCYWGPRLAHVRESLVQGEGPMLFIQTMVPGRFHSFQKDKLIFYVANVNGTRSQLNQVFIAEQPKGSASKKEHWSLVTAQKGNLMTDPHNGMKYFKLMEGRRYDGTPGERDYSIIQFGQYQHLIEETAVKEGLYFHRTMPTQMLLKNASPGKIAELQWRLSIPLSAPLLALLAVPFSRASPRSPRFLRLFIAIIICILYYNLLTLSKRWVAKGVLSALIGVWWVHLILLMGGLLFLAVASGRWEQFYRYILKLKAVKNVQ